MDHEGDLVKVMMLPTAPINHIHLQAGAHECRPRTQTAGLCIVMHIQFSTYHRKDLAVMWTPAFISQ